MNSNPAGGLKFSQSCGDGLFHGSCHFWGLELWSKGKTALFTVDQLCESVEASRCLPS